MPSRERPAAWRRSLHRLGVAAFRRRALLAALDGETEPLAARLAEADAWTPRRLPVNGRDLISLGLTRGPEVGAMLGELEAYWMDQDFAPDRASLLAKASAWAAR